MRVCFSLLAFLVCAWPAAARDVFFDASDGARLHYTEVGPPGAPRAGHGPVLSHAEYMRRFVPGMFRTPQPPAYLARLTAACLVTPADDAAQLLSYPVPRSYWKAAVMSTPVPVLYAVRPGLQGQADNLLIDRPNTSIAVFPNAGHALFVDDARRFDMLLMRFLGNVQWH
jgi:microsomal epoxide hydrolase